MEYESSTSTRSVKLVYVEGCPHWQVALDRLKEAIRRVNPTISVQIQMVASEDDAIAHHMAGSPTILIDGRDPFLAEGPAWSCRLYQAESGLAGTPTVADLVDALSL